MPCLGGKGLHNLAVADAAPPSLAMASKSAFFQLDQRQIISKSRLGNPTVDRRLNPKKFVNKISDMRPRVS